MFFKVCGMRRQQDLDAAAALGFALCGFIFHPKSPRFIEPCDAARLDSRGMLRVGVFVKQDAAETLDICREAQLDLVQLHGDQDEDCLKRLARSVGRQRLVRVLWPERCDGRKEFQKAVDSAAEHCGMVLLDAGKKGGGHGTRLDLPALRKIVFPVPWMLAGGMAEDVFADLAAFPAESRPAGLDFNSKLESAPGEKDAALMSALCRRAADFNLAPMPYPD